MKNCIVFITVLFVLMSLAVFGYGGDDREPREVLTRYLESKLQHRYEELYRYLSEESKEGMSSKEYVEKETMEANIFEKTFADKVRFEIKTIKVDSDHAIADISMTLPDFSEMYEKAAKENMADALKSAFGGKKTAEEAIASIKSQQDITNRVIEKYKNEEVPLTSVDMTIEMVREKGQWKIYSKK